MECPHSILFFRLWLAWLVVGIWGCSPPQNRSDSASHSSLPAPDRLLEAPEEAIRRVQEAPAADGTRYSAWVERQVAQEPGRVLFADWSAVQGTVRYSYALGDESYRVATYAFEWQVGKKGQPVASPRRIELAQEASFP